jgi:hypothetical protein
MPRERAACHEIVIFCHQSDDIRVSFIAETAGIQKLRV